MFPAKFWLGAQPTELQSLGQNVARLFDHRQWWLKLYIWKKTVKIVAQLQRAETLEENEYGKAILSSSVMTQVVYMEKKQLKLPHSYREQFTVYSLQADRVTITAPGVPVCH